MIMEGGKIWKKYFPRLVKLKYVEFTWIFFWYPAQSSLCKKQCVFYVRNFIPDVE